MKTGRAMKKIKIYTDGACSGNPGPGGLGIVIIDKDIRNEIACGFRKTTNNRMEILAVIKALEFLKEDCEVDLYSDSKYVTDAINKKWIYKWQENNWHRKGAPDVLNIDLWIRLLKLMERHKINFVWVKGHNNNCENERCDFLARQAIDSGNLEIDANYENKF